MEFVFKQNNLLEQKHEVKNPYHIFFIQLTLDGKNSVLLIVWDFSMNIEKYTWGKFRISKPMQALHELTQLAQSRV